MLVATAGVMEGMIMDNSDKDYSGGGTTWHGRDIGISSMPAYKTYYKGYGITFTDPSHNLWSLKDNPVNFKVNGISFTNKYQTTGVQGKTTFFKRTEGSLKADYKYSYPKIPSSQKKNTW